MKWTTRTNEKELKKQKNKTISTNNSSHNNHPAHSNQTTSEMYYMTIAAYRKQKWNEMEEIFIENAMKHEKNILYHHLTVQNSFLSSHVKHFVFSLHRWMTNVSQTLQMFTNTTNTIFAIKIAQHIKYIEYIIFTLCFAHATRVKSFEKKKWK